MSTELKLDVDQAGELKAAFRRTRGINNTKWTNEAIKALSSGSLLGKVLDVLNGSSKIIPNEKRVSAKVVDTIIRVDRTAQLEFPHNRRELLYPKLSLLGPAEYDIKNIEQWCHEGQREGAVEGKLIHNCIEGSDSLKDYLGLLDLLAIKRKGIGFFQEHFGGKQVFGWKSIVSCDLEENRSGKFFEVPYLFEHYSRVMVAYRSLNDSWDINRPALRFTM